MDGTVNNRPSIHVWARQFLSSFQDNGNYFETATLDVSQVTWPGRFDALPL